MFAFLRPQDQDSVGISAFGHVGREDQDHNEGPLGLPEADGGMEDFLRVS